MDDTTQITLDDYFMSPANVAGEIHLLRETRRISPDEFYDAGDVVQEGVFILMKRIVCEDGFNFSVQANYGAYCTPRLTHRNKFTNIYIEYEIGYPSEYEQMIIEYAEDSESPTNTVYPYVPKEIIEAVIAKHGGIVRSADTDE